MLVSTVRSSEQHKNYYLWEEMDQIVGRDQASAALICAFDPSYQQAFRPLVDNSKLLPIPTAKATWDEVRRLMPVAEESGIVSNVLTQLLAIKDRKQFETLMVETFPPRAKMDLSIRRNRANDFFSYLKAYQKADLVYLFSSIIKDNFDYIFVCNIMNVTCVLGRPWIDRMKFLGAFDNDLAHYIAVAKKLNDIIKTKGVDDENWTEYAEAATLCGYRNPPFKGFDPVKETQSLAEGGDIHNYYGVDFQELCNTELKMEVLPVTYISFHDYVTKAEWLTAGASSVGSLEVEVEEGKTKKIKAKKNTVPDVYDLEELFEKCLTWAKQENYSIIKSELGKIRMAVASDMPMYLQMSWVNYLLNGAYNQWPGSTTDEDFEAQTKRMFRMLTLCSKMLGLPFDYAAFDHQPTTEELKSIVRVILNAARRNVPISDLAMYDKIAENVLTSFDHSFLEWRNSPERPSFKVEGGLMSGLRFTSLVGNAWNTVMTGLVMRLLTEMGLNTDSIQRYIRGDDSAIYIPNWGMGAMVKLGYDAVGVKAGEGKFSLQARAMEFLRIWYEDRCYGYPMRAIPGLTQRKPWNPEPWAAEGTISAIYEVVRILRRRIPLKEANISKLWNHLKTRWCRNHNLPVACLKTPKFLGGLGVEGGLGPLYRIVPPIRTDKKYPAWFAVTNQNTWRANRIELYYKTEYEENILPERVKEIAKNQLLNTLASDDVPAVSSALRKQWLEDIRHTVFKTELVDTQIEDLPPPIVLDAFPIDNPSMLMTTLKARSELFGSLPRLATVVADYHTLRPAQSLRQWLREKYPAGAAGLNMFHKSWYIGERIDYLIGKLPVQSERIHPMLTEIWQRMIAIQMDPRKHLQRLAFVQLAAIQERGVWSSTLSRQLYSW